VDTGMGFERIVSVLQGVDSNYKTDLFTSSLDVLRSLTGHTEEQMLADFTPYRVIVTMSAPPRSSSRMASCPATRAAITWRA
jgi:alanyl-tRNA synthetase